MMKHLALVSLVAYGVLQSFNETPVKSAGGPLAPGLPYQVSVASEPFEYKGYLIVPMARIDLEARVLGKERYRFDRESDLAPIDLALGWGPMSDSRVLDQLHLSQRNRFLYWTAEQLPIPRNLVVRSASNMHIVPSGQFVERQLTRVRPGQVVKIGGLLIRVEAPDGWRWVSSLTREDSGPGACELVWAERLEVIEPGI